MLQTFLPRETKVKAVSQQLWDKDEVLRQLKFNLHRAQQLMKKYADKKRRELEFSIAYKLCLPAASKIHPLFHVSQLKKVQELPNQFEAQEEHMIEPEHVQGYRPINRNNQMISQVLVQWKGLSTDETTWIDKADFQG